MHRAEGTDWPLLLTTHTTRRHTTHAEMLDEELVLDLPIYSSDDEDEGPASTTASGATGAAALFVGGASAAAPPAAVAATVPPPPPVSVCRSEVDPTYEVERVHWRAMGVAAFRRRCAQSRCPLIITGLGPHLAPGGLSAAPAQ